MPEPPAIPPHVLLVEDEDAAAHALCALLDAEGYRITWAASAAAGVAAVDATVRVIVADLVLPDGFGWQVLERARALGLRVPAIVVSGATGPELGEPLLAHRPVVVLRKPVEAAALLRWIAAAVVG
ncbi:MAG TPA: response regulator [Humisphaera sp.]